MMTKNEKYIKNFKSYNIRKYFVYQDLIFGTPSLLINTVFDLIMRKPKKIYILNSTLYFPLNNQVFNPLQKKYAKFEKLEYVRAFGTHDLISEFLIFKNLFILNYIEVDKSLKKILNLKVESYLRVIEKFNQAAILKYLNN